MEVFLTSHTVCMFQESKVTTFSYLDVLSLPVTRTYEKVVLSNEVRYMMDVRVMPYKGALFLES